jgi:hypothetical protein
VHLKGILQKLRTVTFWVIALRVNNNLFIMIFVNGTMVNVPRQIGSRDVCFFLKSFMFVLFGMQFTNLVSLS